MINLGKLGLIWLTGLILLANRSGAQGILFSDSLDIYNSSTYYELIGSINEKPLVLRTLPERRYAELIRLDSACHLLEIKVLYFLPLNRIIHKDIFATKDYWDIVWQVQDNSCYRVYLQRLDESGNPVQPLMQIDSLERNDTLRKAMPFRIMASDNNEHYLSYFQLPLPAEEAMILHLRTTNILNGESASATVKIPYHGGLDKISHPFVDPEGEVFFIRHDEPLNYKLGSRISLFRMGAGGRMDEFDDLYLKDKKPAELLFVRGGNNLYLGSLYADFYSQKLQGLVSLSFDLEQKKWDSVHYYSFSDEILKQIRKGYYGIPSKELMNSLSLQDFTFDGPKGFSYLITLAHTEYKTNNLDLLLSKDSLNRQGNDNNPDQPMYMAGNMGRRGRGNRGSQATPNPNRAGTSPLGNAGRLTSQIPPLPNVKIANPVVYKTFFAVLDPELQTMEYSLHKSTALPEIRDCAPMAVMQERALMRLSYEMAKEKMSLHALYCQNENKLQKDAEILEGARRLLLLENALIDTGGKWMLSFFRDQQNNGFGIAKWTWNGGQF